jgi:Tfp pilus assembly protein FimT
MLVVIAILGVAASIAIPQASSLSPAAADAVAAEIASAIRFAQREAVRTGTYLTASVNPATQELRVYRPTSAEGATSIHPVDKRDYRISFAGNAMPRATVFSSVFTYEDKAVTNYVTFGPDGAPVDLTSIPVVQAFPGQILDAKKASPLKQEGTITVRHGNAERVVRVAPVTGRVTF